MATDIPAQKVAHTLDLFLTQKQPHYLMLGEDHNSIMTNMALLTCPEVITVLKKHGFEDIALETHYSFQPLADKVAAGEMSTEEFATRVDNAFKDAKAVTNSFNKTLYQGRARMVKTLHAKAIAVHFAENQSALENAIYRAELLSRRFSSLNKRLTAQLKQSGALREIYNRHGGNPAEAFQAEERLFYKALKENPRLYAEYKGLLQARLDNDPALAAFIRERTNGRKTVVLFGAGHGSQQKNGLDECLANGGKKNGAPAIIRFTITADGIHGKMGRF